MRSSGVFRKEHGLDSFGIGRVISDLQLPKKISCTRLETGLPSLNMMKIKHLKNKEEIRNSKFYKDVT